MRVADKELVARQRETAGGLVRRQANGGCVPAQIGLGPGERRFRVAGDDLRQPLPLLRRRAGLGNRCAAEQNRRQKRPGHHRPPHFLHQYDKIDKAEATAAHFFRVNGSEPALLGELLPELVGDRCPLSHALPHELGRALALQEPPRALA
jgi:hypothetical protein